MTTSSQPTAADVRPEIINFEGELVGLGPIRRELLPFYQRWINDFETAKNLALPPGPMTAEAEEAWFNGAATGSVAYFTIYERSTWRPIGNADLRDIDHRNRSAGFGILIGEASCRGKGYGTETTRLILDYAFTALGLHNVLLSVYEYNLAGRRAYEKAGFKEIGRRRQCRAMGGRLWDEIYMDCIATEFESPVLSKVFTADQKRAAE
jgi:RimJ/RimL family protein N-acetyltransferase